MTQKLRLPAIALTLAALGSAGVVFWPGEEPGSVATTVGPAPEARETPRVDPAAAQRIHPNDQRRTIRALEVHKQTGIPLSEHQSQWDAGKGRTDAMPVPLLWPTEQINSRINARVKLMVEQGLVEEARSLWESGDLDSQAGEALGYKQLAAHFRGELTLEQAIERIKIETRRFAKNQRTWLRRLVGFATTDDRASDSQTRGSGDPKQPAACPLDASTLDQERWPDAVMDACWP